MSRQALILRLAVIVVSSAAGVALAVAFVPGSIGGTGTMIRVQAVKAELTAADLEAAPPPDLVSFTIDGEFVKLDGKPSAPHIYTKRRGPGKQSADMPYHLMCYDIGGQLLWRAEVQYLVDLIELPDGRVFVGGTMKTWMLDSGGHVLREETFPAASHIFAHFVLAPDGTILSLLNKSWLYAFSSGGGYLWDYGPGQHQAYRPPIVSHDEVIILHDHNYITALSMQGIEIWQREFSRVGDVSLVGDSVIYEPDDFTVAALDLHSGKDLWHHEYSLSRGQFSFTSYRVTSGDTILLWALQGGVQCLGADGEVLWNFDESYMDRGLRNGLDDLCLGINDTIFASMESRLLAFAPDGKLHWNSTFPASSLDFMRTGGDFLVLKYTDYSSVSVGRFAEEDRLLCFDSAGRLVWNAPEDMNGVASRASFLDSGAILWHIYDGRNKETATFNYWQP